MQGDLRWENVKYFLIQRESPNSSVLFFSLTSVSFIHLLGVERSWFFGQLFLPFPHFGEEGTVGKQRPELGGIFIIISDVKAKGASFTHEETRKSNVLPLKENRTLSKRGWNKIVKMGSYC